MHAGQHMQAMQEVPLEHLAARYSDSEGEEEGAKPEQQPDHAAAQQAAVGAAAPPPAGAATAADAAAAASSPVEASGSEEGEEDWEDEDWYSEDDDLASALEWADLREGGHEAAQCGGGCCRAPAALASNACFCSKWECGCTTRTAPCTRAYLPCVCAVQESRAGGGGGALTLGSHRPNAHGGALNRGPAKLLPTAGNMGRLDSHFNAGAVQLRDDPLDSLAGYGGTAGSAVHNQVKAAHSGKAATAGARSKDRSDRATGASHALDAACCLPAA
jgi:hypothetical protein